MMISDAERREVAMVLRGARYGWRSWERALYDALGVDTETAGFDMLDRLADLIDPSCDRDALLKLADELEQETGSVCGVCMGKSARRIRKALRAEPQGDSRPHE